MCLNQPGSRKVQVQSAVPGTMPRIERCTFSRNSANQNGGALRIESVTGDVAVEACAFTDNWACAGGGGISIVSASNVYIRSSLFIGNSAIARGCVQDSYDQWTLSAGGGIWHVRASVTHACSLNLVLLACFEHMQGIGAGQSFSSPAHQHECHVEHGSVRRWSHGF